VGSGEAELDFDETRLLRPSDAAPAAALIRAAFAEQGKTTDPPSSALRETAEIVAKKLAAGGGAGIERDGALVGLVLWAPQTDALYCGRLAIAPAWRGRGFAGVLIEAAGAEARRRGLSILRLNARLELPGNRRLFARLGFAEVGLSAHPGYPTPTIVVMEKILA
jgi:GNAT superfamily N-acetyltransferase